MLENNIIVDKIPRLVNMCGRSEESVNYFFQKLFENPNKITKDFLSLINDISKTSPFRANCGYNGMNFRGFALIENFDQNLKGIKNFNVKEINEKEREVWFIIPGIGSQWTAMAKDLIKIEFFEKTIKSLSNILSKFSINLWDLLTDEKQNICDSVMKSLITITCIQIALIDLLEELDISANGVIGHSFGELVCAYAQRCLTKEDTLLIAYWRAKSIEDNIQCNKPMINIGLSREKLKTICSSNTLFVEDIGEKSVNVLGEENDIKELTQTLKIQNIPFTYVQNCGIPVNTQYIHSLHYIMSNNLKEFHTKILCNSKKWISTLRDSENSKCETISIQYFLETILLETAFNTSLQRIPNNAIVIGISPNCLYENSIKESLGPNISYIPLMKKNENNLHKILSNIGSIYTLGLNPKIERIYPSVEYPVSNGTQFISPFVKWDHSIEFDVRKYPKYFNKTDRPVIKFKHEINIIVCIINFYLAYLLIC